MNVLGFKPKKNIDIAIKDLIKLLMKKFSNTFENDDYFNIKDAKNKFNMTKVRYSYLPQQFNNCPELWKNLKSL